MEGSTGGVLALDGTLAGLLRVVAVLPLVGTVAGLFREDVVDDDFPAGSGVLARLVDGTELPDERREAEAKLDRKTVDRSEVRDVGGLSSWLSLVVLLLLLLSLYGRGGCSECHSSTEASSAAGLRLCFGMTKEREKLCSWVT